MCLLSGMVGGPNPKAKNWLDGHGSISAGKNTNCLRVTDVTGKGVRRASIGKLKPEKFT